MRILPVLAIVICAVASPRSNCSMAEEQRAPQKTRRILYNCDGCSCMFYKKDVYTPSEITQDDLRAITDELKQPESQVDTFLLCVNAQVLFYPSKVGTMIGSVMSADDRKGLPAHVQQWIVNLEGFHASGVDPYAVILAEAKKRGLETLISYRMNDAHGNNFLLSAFHHEHPEYRLNGGLEFGQEPVRDYTFRIIEEIAQRYDCDGIELDFNRFPTYFSGGESEERIATINSLVERIRTMIEGESKRRNRRLVLAARVPTSYQQCQEIGLDPVAWANEGWIDFLTVSEFLFVRYDLPVKPWTEKVQPVPVYASIECTEGSKLEQCLTAEKYRRASRHLWSDGADGIYLFNFFTTREWHDQSFEPPFEVLEELGSLKTLELREGSG